LALKKQQFAEGEIAIFDLACIYKRGECWQFRMWLPKDQGKGLKNQSFKLEKIVQKKLFIHDNKSIILD